MDWSKIPSRNRIAEFIRRLGPPPIHSDTGLVELDDLNKRHEECSRNLRNSVLIFASFSANF